MSIFSLALSANAEDLTQVDRLTQQWLDTERQASLVQNDWQAQRPILEQRLALLNAEKTQLQTILTANSASQNDVEERRAELLAEQSLLEKQQQELVNALDVLVTRMDGLGDLLPPPLKDAWNDELNALGEKPETSQQLQVSLAQLSRLADFDQRLSVHEMVVTVPGLDNKVFDGKDRDVLVKQLYLGVGMSWFTSADGSYAGWGQANNDGWSWHFGDVDAAEISKAIAIFEKRQQADFVRLPVTLADLPASGETQP